MCKRTPVCLFQEELEVVMLAWGRRKSAGPDGVSYEALRAMPSHEMKWKHRLFEVFSDALYTARLPHSTDSQCSLPRRCSLLLGQTRPSTLSSVVLRVFSQLLLARCRHLLLDPVGGEGETNSGARSSSTCCEGWREWRPTGG